MTAKPEVQGVEIALKCPSCDSGNFRLVRRWRVGQYIGQRIADIPMRVVCSHCDLLAPDIQIIDLYNLPD